ncbi:SIS domain-containing protein [Methylobacterium platani]|uniref:Fe-S cluster assembly protein HesB n=1 Tax=Methylobacterium platani JCM 14648 TaxID=1295136 RepID=A0ABR5H2N8_9HYPH|nr:SIS domain-containing protein [Methylobacterium platani]KMO17702.1 Fe-S cluster assembly protein HesB [Methylobacterium platani JCM 14648]
MPTPYRQALAELEHVFARLDDAAVDAAVAAIAGARRIALHGVGREGLQVRGLAMRLFHLGLDASVVGDMTTPPIEAGDLLVVSAGPGGFPTIQALIDIARAAGAAVLVVTAQAGGEAARHADHLVVVPAQTMADDVARDGAEEGSGVSILPMGSLYEGALFVLFEVIRGWCGWRASPRG